MFTVFYPRRLEIEERVKQLAIQRNYPLDVTEAIRTLGPRPDSLVPPAGTEVCLSKIPREVFEDKLFPLFETAGSIYKFRMMMSPSGISNRGTALVTYETTEMAMAAIEMFNDMEIVPGHRIQVRKAMDNRRLFIGGIPECKTKDQIWHELIRIGIRGIMEVIMYRSYIDKNRNRGFVFVEFASHEEAARVRAEYKNAFIFGNRVQVDWSAPLNNVDEETMKRVTKLFIRNLNVLLDPPEFTNLVVSLLGGPETLEKVYKYRDYAFIHFISRRDAQRGMSILREHFKLTNVEVDWAKPVQKKADQDSPSSSSSSSPNKPTTGGRRAYKNRGSHSREFGNQRKPNSTQFNFTNNNNGVRPMYCFNCLSQITEQEIMESTRRTFETLNL